MYRTLPVNLLPVLLLITAALQAQSVDLLQWKSGFPDLALKFSLRPLSQDRESEV